MVNCNIGNGSEVSFTTHMINCHIGQKFVWLLIRLWYQHHIDHRTDQLQIKINPRVADALVIKKSQAIDTNDTHTVLITEPISCRKNKLNPTAADDLVSLTPDHQQLSGWHKHMANSGNISQSLAYLKEPYCPACLHVVRLSAPTGTSITVHGCGVSAACRLTLGRPRQGYHQLLGKSHQRQKKSPSKNF